MVASKHFTVEEAKRIGEALGVDWSKFDMEQFRMGLDVELEHGVRNLRTNVTHDNEMITGKIALAHLSGIVGGVKTKFKRLSNRITAETCH